MQSLSSVNETSTPPSSTLSPTSAESAAEARQTNSVSNNNNNASNSKKNGNFRKQQSQSKSKQANFNNSNNINRSNLNKARGGGNYGPKYENSLRDDLTDQAVYGLNGVGVRNGSKKTNLNHLLNFTYESSRDSNENYYEYERATKQFWSMKLTKNSYFSKEQFLQANCQFVVKDTGDYSIHMSDPDKLVSWDKIEEIFIDSHESMSCPICLYEPVAAKMTKCGHVYCWSCILHYLSLSDKQWRKCPICFESIYKNDLKSVKIIKDKAEFKVGDQIELNLMFKHKKNNKYNALILPYVLNDQFNQDERNKNFNLLKNNTNNSTYSNYSQYFKLHIKCPGDILNTVVKREREQLKRQQKDEKDQPEVCFVNEALVLLEEREKFLEQEISSSPGKTSLSRASSETDSKKKNDEVKVNEKKIAEYEYVDAFEDIMVKKQINEPGKQDEGQNGEEEVQEAEEEVVDEKPSTPDPTESSQTHSKSTSSDLSYFYQSVDGQRIYINSLNTRCLLSEYNNSHANFPLTLKGKIVAVDSHFMTEENRKRFKYLSHLPLHTEFKLVELDLKEPYVSQKTLDLFIDEIMERKRMRERKEIREKRHADRAAAAMEISAMNSHPHYIVQSAMTEERFIQQSVVDYTNEFPEASSSPPNSIGTSTSESCSSNSSTSSSNNANFSFAQMLKNRSIAKATSAWPSLESAASPPVVDVSSTQLTSGWLSLVQANPSGRTKKYQDEPTPWTGKPGKTSATVLKELETDEGVPVPMYKQSFFSAIDESLKLIESKKSGLCEVQSPTGVDDPHDQGKNQPVANKKKKKTKQLLFST